MEFKGAALHPVVNELSVFHFHDRYRYEVDGCVVGLSSKHAVVTASGNHPGDDTRSIAGGQDFLRSNFEITYLPLEALRTHFLKASRPLMSFPSVVMVKSAINISSMVSIL